MPAPVRPTPSCPVAPPPVSSSDPPDPRREAPRALRTALGDASDEAFLGLQSVLNSRDLLNDLTPALADAYARRWLRLAARPRAWFVEQGAWDATDVELDDGPMRRLAGDPAQLLGANSRLAVAEALAAGRIASEARLHAIRIAADGGIPVAEAIRRSADSMDERERQELDGYDLLAPASRVPAAEPPSEYAAAKAWYLEDALHPLGRLARPFRERFVQELAESADSAPLSPADASSVLAQHAVEPATHLAAMDLFRRVRWPVDLVRLPAPFARALIDRIPHAPLTPAQRAQLFGGTEWTKEALRAMTERGDLGAINALTRWRVRDSAPALRETAAKAGNFYPSDGAAVALAALGDTRALAWFADMLARGPGERVWQLMNQPLPYAPTPEIIDLLLDAAADGRREARDVISLMRRWFGGQVDVRGASPYDRSDAIAAWRAWWTGNRSAWCWDAWSARFWPIEVWSDD